MTEEIPKKAINGRKKTVLDYSTVLIGLIDFRS